MAIDHVLLAVGDLERGSELLRERHGLTALPGGRHPGAGTANLIVPLGPDYLELITIADPAEAATNHLSRRVSNAIQRGATFAAWALRVPDLDRSKRALDDQGIESIGPRDGSRIRPDGVLIRWRTLHVGDGLNAAIPFLIEWQLAPGEHPGNRPVEHPAGKVSLASLLLAARDADSVRRMIRLLGGADLPVEVQPGEEDRVVAVVLEVDGARREVR